MAWAYGMWSAEHPLRIGVTQRAQSGARVRAGDVIAAGIVPGTALRLPGARRLGLPPGDVERQLRTPIGSDVLAGTVIARTGRRFPRSLTAPADGRLLHVTREGDVYLAPMVDRWIVRSTLDGEVSSSDDARVTVRGEAWRLAGVAAYGPDAVGELTLAVDSATGEMVASRLDVRLDGRILVGGARVSAEVMTRAHACGIAGVVGGAAPAAGLRVVYGDTVTASGAPMGEDRPTVLCLMGFGSAVVPHELFDPLVALAGSRAAIHTSSARLFVFASADAGDFATAPPELVLAGDYSAVRAAPPDRADAGEAQFPSELRTRAIRIGGDVVPAANVRRSDPER